MTYLNLILDTVGSTGTVLDLGCGTGELLAQFFIGKGFKITAVKKWLNYAKSVSQTNAGLSVNMGYQKL